MCRLDRDRRWKPTTACIQPLVVRFSARWEARTERLRAIATTGGSPGSRLAASLSQRVTVSPAKKAVKLEEKEKEEEDEEEEDEEEEEEDEEEKERMAVIDEKVKERALTQSRWRSWLVVLLPASAALAYGAMRVHLLQKQYGLQSAFNAFVDYLQRVATDLTSSF